MNKFLIGLLVVIAIAAGAYYIRGNNNQTNEPTDQSQNTQPTPTPEPTSSVKTYTLEEVAQHGPSSPDYENLPVNQACWMAIHGKVYAIPDNFTETHPGGHVIYDGCGTDATTLFETRPMGTGTPHSENARSILEKYYIGDLKK